jgi:hypothetical protein
MNEIARKLREAVGRDEQGIVVKGNCPEDDYDIEWLVGDAADEIEQLQQWKDGVRGFLGQFGVESISAMLNIMETARRWVHWCRKGSIHTIDERSEELGARSKLCEAVEAYDAMVAKREEER